MTVSQSLISKTSSSRDKSLNVNATPKPAKSSASSPALRSTVRQPKQSSNSASQASSLSSLSTSVEHHCAHCGSTSLQLKHVTRSFGKGAALLVIEAIPLWSSQAAESHIFQLRRCTRSNVSRRFESMWRLIVRWQWRLLKLRMHNGCSSQTRGLRIPPAVLVACRAAQLLNLAERRSKRCKRQRVKSCNLHKMDKP